MKYLIAGDVMVDVLTFLQDDIRFGDDNRATIEFAGGGVSANVAAWMAFAGERTMFPSAGANVDLPFDIFDLEVQPGDHVHVSGYFLLRDYSRPTALHYIATAKQHGATVSLDPASARLIETMGAEAVLEAMRGVDLMLCNQMEAMALTGLLRHQQAAEALGRRFPAAIVKLGADGACSWDGQDLVTVPAEPSTVLSTVGAGDAFDAAAIVAWKRGLPLAEVLAAGNHNGHLVVQQRGARPRIQP